MMFAYRWARNSLVAFSVLLVLVFIIEIANH